jgi:hypothetical protein
MRRLVACIGSGTALVALGLVAGAVPASAAPQDKIVHSRETEPSA